MFQILFDIWWFPATRIFPSDHEVHQARGEDCCVDTSDMIMTQLGYRNYWLGATVTRPTDVDITGINSNHISLQSRQRQQSGLEKYMIGHLQGVIEKNILFVSGDSCLLQYCVQVTGSGPGLEPGQAGTSGMERSQMVELVMTACSFISTINTWLSTLSALLVSTRYVNYHQNSCRQWNSGE